MDQQIAIGNKGLSAFLQCVEPIYDAEDVTTFWRCRPCFEKLLESDFLKELVSSELKRALLVDSELVRPHDLNLARIPLNNGMKIDVLLLDDASGKSPFQCTAEHTMFGFGAPAEAVVHLDLYRLPQGYRNDVFDGSAALCLESRSSMRPMEVIEVNADERLYHITSCRGQVAVVFLRFSGQGQFAWNFDVKSLLEIEGISVDYGADRLCFTAKLLGQIGSSTSIEALKTLSMHSSHRVRWTAAQALFEIDFDAALEQLKKAAAHDPHPSIRQSAGLALTLIKSL